METQRSEATGGGLADAFDVRDVVVRQLAGARERPHDLQEAEAHEIRAEGDAQIHDPLRQLEVGRGRVGMCDVPHEAGRERADDAGEQRPRAEPEQHVELARPGRQPVDHHVDADVDPGAYAVRRAELCHPHEHVDAKLLRPGQVDLEKPVLQQRDGHTSGVAVDDSDEDQQRGRAHRERDQPLLEVVENLHGSPLSTALVPGAMTARTVVTGPRAGIPLRHATTEARTCLHGLNPVALYTSARMSLPTRDSFSLWTDTSAFFICAFSSGVSAMICVLPLLRTASSASSFSFLAMSLAYLVASFIAPSSVVRTSAGRPSQNFLFVITAYSITPWSV